MNEDMSLQFVWRNLGEHYVQKWAYFGSYDDDIEDVHCWYTYHAKIVSEKKLIQKSSMFLYVLYFLISCRVR